MRIFGNSQHNFANKRGRRNLLKKRVLRQQSESPLFYNPYKKTSRSKLFISAFIFPILILGWISLLLFLPYFQIKQILVSGINITNETDVQDLLKTEINKHKLGIPLNNYFLIKKDNLANTLKNSFAFNNVYIEKVFPNTIVVSVEEKKPVLVYDDGNNYFLLDSSGTAIEILSPVKAGEWTTTTKKIALFATTTMSTTSTATPTLSGLTLVEQSYHEPNYVKIKTLTKTYLPILYDERGISIKIRQEKVLSEELIKNILALYLSLQRAGIAKINYIQMNEPISGMVFNLNKPWKLFIPSYPAEGEKFNASDQIKIIISVLASNKPTEYIDLRYSDHIYWK